MKFEVLKETPIFQAFSTMGKEIFQPNGIFYWSGRSKKEADLNATIGTAMGMENEFIENGRDKFVPFYIPELKDYISIEPERFVAYAPMGGLPNLRQIWSDWIIYKGKNLINDPSESVDVAGQISLPLICSGITNAIFLMARFFLDKGQPIITPEKRWGNYDSILTRQNGIPIESFTFFKDGKFNTSALLEKVKEVGDKIGKVVLLINFPNNPTGYAPTAEEIESIIEGLKGYVSETDGRVPVVVLCDDAYEGYVFDEKRVKHSIFYHLVGQHPSIIPVKLDGSSKEMLMYGARVAAITLGLHPDWYNNDEKRKEQLLSEWNNKMEAMIRSTVSNCNRYSQELLYELLKKGFDHFVEEREKVLGILKDRFQETIIAYEKTQIPGVTMDPAGGGFFVFLNVEGVKANELADHLLTKYKLGTIPINKEDLGINGLRVAYCSVEKDRIKDVFTRIKNAIEDLRK